MGAAFAKNQAIDRDGPSLAGRVLSVAGSCWDGQCWHVMWTGHQGLTVCRQIVSKSEEFHSFIATKTDGSKLDHETEAG